jgi:transcription initiation factor TFIIB
MGDTVNDDVLWRLLKELSDVTDLDLKCPSKNICYFCRSDNIVLEDGNYICYDCNTLNERFIDMQAEWRYYGADDNKSSDPTRCGMPVNELLPDSSLGSVISNQLNESYDMKLIKKYHMWNSITYKERSLYNIFENITVNAINGGIPISIIEQAKTYYKQVSESRISRGENRSGLIATSIYMSCKSNNVPRSTKEIAKIFNLKATTMTRGCKKFNDILKININSSHPVDFIQRFCSKLNLENGMREICKKIIEKADELNIICESSPPSIASGAIYLCNSVYELGMSKKDISEACNVSQVTLAKISKKMLLYKDHLIKDL